MTNMPASANALAIVEALQQQHGKIERMLAAFERQVAIFEAGGSPDYELTARILAFSVAYLSPQHLAAERPLLMALIDRHLIDGLETEALETQYDEIVEGAREASRAVEAVFRDAEVRRESLSQIARDFIDSCRRHMKTEEQLFFPTAIESLGPSDWEAIERAISTATGVSSDVHYESGQAQYQALVRWDETG